MFLIFEDFLTDKYCIFLAFVLEVKSQNWAAGLVILKVKCLDDYCIVSNIEILLTTGLVWPASSNKKGAPSFPPNGRAG